MWDVLQNWFLRLPDLGKNAVLTAVALIAGIAIRWILSFFLSRVSSRSEGFSMLRSMVLRLSKPVTFFLPVLIFSFVLPYMILDARVFTVLRKTTDVLLIITFAVVLVGLAKVVEDYVYHFYGLDDDIHNLKERKIRTQLVFIRKIVIVVIVILTICAILLSFESLKRIGAGLLTGVGVGGIIIGFAAQRSLGNLFAGLQIAFTQPIRIDDALLVEGEWGIVEEITLTYVVVKLWDQRRLILPINYFIERPFQNWTRASTELLGTVFLFLDYTAPVEAIRAEFNRLLESTPLWDRRAAALQVTNASENTMELRALVSAANSGATFELRCFIREKLLEFIQKNHPEALPKARTMWMGEKDTAPEENR